MALPPYAARPGLSRRAQLGLFAGYVVAVLGALLALLMALTARFDPTTHARLQGLAADVTRPIAVSGRIVAGWVNAGLDGIFAYVEAGSKNRILERKLRAQRAELLAARALVVENGELKRLVRLVEPAREVVATGRLIASTGSSSRRYATLSVGQAQGVQMAQPVISADGLIGRTVAVGLVTARVLLLTDTSAIVPLQRLSDGAAALGQGRGDGLMDVRGVAAGLNAFRRGDVFVTSGAGGIFPPNVPVAVALQATRDGVIARPLADPTRLDFVQVERAQAGLAADLPPVEGGP